MVMEECLVFSNVQVTVSPGSSPMVAARVAGSTELVALPGAVSVSTQSRPVRAQPDGSVAAWVTV